MDGVLNIRKTSGPTSHDVVDEIRRIFGQKRVGHAGTLDPMASGVLVVCLGRATRVVEYVMGAWKEYRARMVLGVSTDTQDSTGAVISEQDASGVDRGAFEEAAAAYIGEIDQVPPMVSAVKHEGKRLYELARQGKEVVRAPRRITIYSIDVSEFGPIPDSQFPVPNSAEIVVRCSSGTYIRTLCADIGEKLGCGAHMSALERTAVGQFKIEDSVTVEDLQQAAGGQLESRVLSINEALALVEVPAVHVAQDDVLSVANGREAPCRFNGGEGAVVRILAPDGGLVAVGTISHIGGETMVNPHKVLGSEHRSGRSEPAGRDSWATDYGTEGSPWV